MPLQGLMLILFMIVLIPVLIIFSNPDIFFILISIILLYTSLKNIFLIIFKTDEQVSEAEEELSEDFEQAMNVNVKKFKEGISASINLIIILFFIYCIFFISNFNVKVLIGLIITYRLSNVLKLFGFNKNESSNLVILKLKQVFPIFIDFLSIIIIIFISIEKYLILNI